MAGITPKHWHFGKSLVPLFADAAVEHRDAVFSEGGRLRGERHASEYESVALGGDTGLYSPRIRLQVSEDEPFAHTKATMCRTDRYKYIRRLYETDELYDLVADPHETLNLIESADHASIRAALLERLLRWYQETCDVVPVTSDQRNFPR